MPLKVIQGHRFLVQIDFLLVINTNLLPILHRFRDIDFDTSEIVIFGTPLACNPPDTCRRPLHHIIVNDISLKLEALDYISFAESLEISSTTFTQCAPNAINFAEITQNNGHCAV